MTAFEPCPICGRKIVAERNLYFVDIDGEMMYELERVTQFDDIVQDESVNMSFSDEYVRDLLDDVDKVCISCPCGYSLNVDASSVGFPDKGWLDRFKARANKRATNEVRPWE